MAVPESELDRLFSLPLDQFVAERKRIAKTLAQAGQKEEARVLDKIARPTVSAWAVNQVARRDPALVRRLGELTERLRGAQGRTSDGGANDFAAMTAEHRQALGTLRDMIDGVLAEGGHEANPQLVRRAITNLRAGVAAPDTRPSIERGRLVRDVEEADFTTLFEALPPASGMRDGHPPARRAAPPPPPLPPGRPKQTDQDDSAATRRMAAERAEREAERTREKARASAERRLVRLRETAAKAAAALVAEERTVAAARAALAAKEEHLERVRDASEKAAADVAEVEAELERLRG